MLALYYEKQHVYEYIAHSAESVLTAPNDVLSAKSTTYIIFIILQQMKAKILLPNRHA